MPTGQRSGGGPLQQVHDRREDRLGLRHPAIAEFATGHGSHIGPDEMHAVALEGREIPLRRGMLPHAYVHRRGHQHRLVGRQQGGGGQIAGEAVGGLGHQVRRRRGHDHQVGRAGKLDVAHLRFVGQGEQFAVDPVLGQGRQGQRRDERGARRRQDRPHGDARLAQQPRQRQRLIGGDAAPDDQQNPPLAQIRTPSAP